MPIFVGNSTVNTAIANSTITVDQTNSFAYATSNRNSIRPSLILDFARSQTVDPRITFTRASSATYFNSLGVLSTAANNVPRIDYNPATGVCNGLLVEQASTNIVLNSTTLSTQSVTTTATTYTLSFYGTGTVALSGTYSGSLVGTGAFPVRSTLSFTATAGTLTLTVTGTVSYAQLEALAFPTSYIPTTGASASRVVEVVSANIQNYFNTTQGSIVMGFTQNYPTVAGSPWGLFSLQDAGATNTSRARIQGSGSTVINFDSTAASVTDTGQTTINSWTMGSLNKIGLSWSYASSSTYNKIYALNGVSGSSTPAITLPVNNYILYIGAWNNATFPLTGWVSSITYYPIVLSNTELQTLTS